MKQNFISRAVHFLILLFRRQLIGKAGGFGLHLTTSASIFRKTPPDILLHKIGRREVWLNMLAQHMEMRVLRFLWVLMPMLILLSLTGCDKPIEQEEEPQMPEKYDISGNWNLYAWFPLDSPEGLEYRYDITGGELFFDVDEYTLNLYYTYYDQADSLIEMGTFYYSSEYFVSWNGESTLFWGYIDFYPLNGEFWTVRWRTGFPPDMYNQVIFRNFNLRNDTTMVMLYWLR